MALGLLLARLLLVGVFLVAGLAKLADLSGSQQSMRHFGLPTPLGVLLPVAELVVAAALLPTLSAWWGALGALILLLLFIAGISFNLAFGRRPECHCFGQLHSEIIGWPTLLRNLVLVAITGFVAWQGQTDAGLSILAWLGLLAMAQRIELGVGLILAALLALAGWVLLQVLRQQGRLLTRLEVLEAKLNDHRAQTPTSAQAGLPVGSRAPTFALLDLSGETITLDFLRASGKPVLLVFSDLGCGPCRVLMPEVGRWQRDHAGKLTIALVSRGSPEANRAKAAEHGITRVLLQQDREVALAYLASGTPSAVLVRTDGTIGNPLALGAEAIRSLVAGGANLPTLRLLPMATPANSNGH